MKLKIKFFYILAILLFFAIQPMRVIAEWNKSAQISNYYDSNPFHIDTTKAVNFSSLSLLINYLPDSSDFSFKYSGSLTYADELERSFFSENGISSTYSTTLDTNGVNTFQSTLLYDYRNNSANYKRYNANDISLSAKYFRELSETDQFRIGYKGEYNNYYNDLDLSNSEHSGFLGIRSYYETNTSVNLGLEYGYKFFSNSLFSVAKGKNSKNNNSQSASQLIANINIGQSLAEKTGISVSFLESWKISSSYSSVSKSNVEAIFDKEIYDDPYSYESRELEVKLTHFFHDNIKCQLLASYYNKNYSYNADLTDGGSSDKRKDEELGLGVNLEYLWEIEESFIKQINFSLSFLASRNNSNASVFTYHSSEIKASAQISF